MAVPSSVEMHPVTSSNVAAVGYDPADGSLYVAFRGGQSYRYAGVPGPVFRDFLAAPSKGTFLWEHVRNFGRDDLYPCTRA